MGLVTEPTWDILWVLAWSGYSITDAIDYFGDNMEPRLAESGRLLFKLSLIMIFWFLNYPVGVTVWENWALLALCWFLRGGLTTPVFFWVVSRRVFFQVCGDTLTSFFSSSSTFSSLSLLWWSLSRLTEERKLYWTMDDFGESMDYPAPVHCVWEVRIALTEFLLV